MKYKFRSKLKFLGNLKPDICFFLDVKLAYKYMVVHNRNINSGTLTLLGELDENAWQ